MLTAELKVNGVLISHLYCHNIGPDGPHGTLLYNWQYYDIESASMKSGTIAHDRKKGAAALIASILKEQTK